MTLPNDVCRCVGTTCGKRDTCARFMDVPAGPIASYADFSPKNGAECLNRIPCADPEKR